jgi:acetoin utilization protein AcuC
MYSDDYLQYNFGRGHPLNQTRLKLAYEMMKAYGFFKRDDVKLYKPPPANEEDLLLFHDEDYVNYVKNLSGSQDREYYLHGFGPGDNPVFDEVFRSAGIHVGGTIRGCDLIMKGEVDHVFSLGGGYHHALKSRASGFCVFNDPAIAIRYLQTKYSLDKVVYVDIDAHHGDGVQIAFNSDPSVMTISLHESGRFLFPGTGFVDEMGKGDAIGTKVNVALPMNTTDRAYLYAFEEIVAPLIKSFEPDFLLAQCGGDAHYSDPLTHLLLTTKSYRAISKIYHELSHEVMNGRWMCVTGGGYDLLACARIWSVMLSEMCEITLENKIPEEYIRLCNRILGYEPPDVLEDEEKSVRDERHVQEAMKEIVREIKEHIFPYHSL